MPLTRRRFTAAPLLALPALGLAACASSAAAPAPDALDAPNVVPISPRLVTSGQPTRAALEGLGARGFGGVIYLAPSTVPDAVRDEAAIVERQGLRYVNIPIPFNKPGDADFDAFVAAMDGMKDRQVLVHCQVNMRGSSMVFLYRVIAGHEPPEAAYEAVTKVWSPDGVWKQFIVAQLHRHGVDFEPY
ncbi:MAG: protein tyrosine phosphatase family protein [Burkholderiaceae bacterium]